MTLYASDGLVLGAAVTLAGYALHRQILVRVVVAVQGTRLRPLVAAGPARVQPGAG